MASDLIIRLMVAADMDACAAIMMATPLWQRYGVTQASAAARLSEGLASGGLLFVAVHPHDPAVPLGFVWAIHRGAFNRSGYIPLLAVADSTRRSGVGRWLLDTAENDLRRTSADVFLLCSDFNQAAQRFYERQGYVQIGSLPDYVLPGIAELIYRKRLQRET